HTALADPLNAHWLRCGGTWFVGVDALPNDAEGRLDGGDLPGGAAFDFVRATLRGGELPLHRAQISVCFPGYPKPSTAESGAAFRFRVTRDAAHVDGLLLGDPQRRRFLREPHAWILGIGLETPGAGASPTVLWEGSHRSMGPALAAALAEHASTDWPHVDITAPYQQARREVIARCARIPVPLACGETLLLHRHLLHGIAPWEQASAGSEGQRTVAWFRPQFHTLLEWLGTD
ncbi:MAG: hypothetical protein ACKO4A_05725, partial [Gammaproteobacteria bacterium]